MIPAFVKKPWLVALFFLALAMVQLLVLPRKESVDGRWFLYGRDTVSHDALVHLWVQQAGEKSPGTIPLWMPGLQGGLPTLGAFLWTPFSPAAWPFLILEYPEAQKAAWILALWLAGCGGFLLGRNLRLGWAAALLLGSVYMLSGHVVTLIHAGHFQKVAALGFLPWAVAGSVMMSHPHGWRRPMGGAALMAFGVGMMLLAGHPQIAYTGLLTGFFSIAWWVALRRAARQFWWRSLIVYIAGTALGLSIGGAQLVPGMEMSALSNRGGGVSYREAVETSYPPGELMELLVPRWKGSSVRGDVYTGGWGERIVSDYAGKAVIALALIALIGSIGRLRAVLFWLLMAGMWLLVGLGDSTPLYRAFYDYLPGFASFRSPGTFMAGAALSFAVLAAWGVQSIAGGLKNFRQGNRFPWVYPVILAAAVADLGWANRHFLLAEPWNRYEAYLAPRQAEFWLQERGEFPSAHGLTNELSLRPVLYGGRALNGYHPIVYQAKARQDGNLGYNTPEWYRAWGVAHLILPDSEQVGADGFEVVYRGGGQQVVQPPAMQPFLSLDGEEPDETAWNRRNPNDRTATVAGPPGELRLAEVFPPGMRLYKDGDLLAESSEPALATTTQHPGGTAVYRWEYRPLSYRLGLFATAMGGLVVLGVAGAARRRKRR